MVTGLMTPGESHIERDLAAQLEALTATRVFAGATTAWWCAWWATTAPSFLHGMCSNDIKDLKPGMVTYALVLTDHAHIVADLYVWADESAL